jgi:large subunit ribosomal protein L18
MNKALRIKKHNKVRRRIVGTESRPRLSVFRSNQHIYAQIIDDTAGKTLVAESDLKLKENKSKRAFEVGKKLAEKAVKAKITEVVFDRGGFLYHGRIAEVAKGAREGGLKF